MRTVKASTAVGKRLIRIGTNWEGTHLYQVYDRWSQAKQEAWEKCYDEYSNTEGANGFSICSHNTYQFTCSWFISDGSMRLETRDNSYLIIFDEPYKDLFDDLKAN